MSDQQRIEDSLLRWRFEPAPWGGFVDGERRFDHGQVALWSLRFAERLVQSGVSPGDPVAIHLDHVAEAVIAIYGTWIAGALAVPVNGSLKSPQIAHILQHSKSRILVSTTSMLARLDAATLAGIETLSVPECAALAGEEQAWTRQRTFDGGETPAAILYSSGSSGRPKGILVSHANLRAGTRIVAGYLGIQDDERILSVLPFSFDYGLNQLLSAVQRGCTLVLQRSHFPGDVLRSLVEQRITGLAGVPPFWAQLLRGSAHPELAKLRYITNSGGAFPVELVRRCRERMPELKIHLMYGLSEAFRSTCLPPEDLDAHPNSIGKAIPETDVLVLDSENRRCAPGEAGELVHRGPTVALGYWNDPRASAHVFRPDPDDRNSPHRVVYSGDIVSRDTQGYITFIGRSDQLMKCYGYRVSPDEVEELIQDSRLVAEVAVHGRPDGLSGAAIVARVIPADPTCFATSTLLEYCRTRMPAYMVPKVVEVHEALPRTPSGKIDRWALSR